MALLFVKGMLIPGASAVSWRKLRVGSGIAESVRVSMAIPISELLDGTSGGASLTVTSEVAPATLSTAFTEAVSLMPARTLLKIAAENPWAVMLIW
jgi:hypothetical protein